MKSSSPPAIPNLSRLARRRMAGDRAELHLGHDRRSQGGRVSSSRRVSELVRQRGRVEHAAARPLPVDAADVSLQRLVLYLGLDGVAGTHVCLRRTTAEGAYAAIAEHDVTHFCGAPIVLNMLANAPVGMRRQGGPHDRGDDRRHGSAGGRDRGHGSARLSRYARVWPDGNLRPGRDLRLARGVERVAARPNRRR